MPPADATHAYFPTLPPGAALPTGEECARRVRRSSWEPRPGNATANETPGSPIVFTDGRTDPFREAYGPRIDGNFTGTTDEILQWGACKWGFDEDMVRAMAVQESYWDQATVGDHGQSFGLLQVKVTVHNGTWPQAKTSTAFGVDYALAFIRACYEGYLGHYVPRESVGDVWGCVGLWYIGDWSMYDVRAEYAATIKRHLAEKAWLGWS